MPGTPGIVVNVTMLLALLVVLLWWESHGRCRKCKCRRRPMCGCWTPWDKDDDA